MKALASVLLLVLLSVAVSAQPSGCDDCSRTAVLGQTTLNDPMGLVATAAYRPSVLGHLSELMVSPCFHFSGADVDAYSGSIREKDKWLAPSYGSEAKEAEYLFESEFVSSLNETDANGRYVRSKWTITLYFNGETREMVHQWQTTGTQEKRPARPDEPSSGTTFSGHVNKLEQSYKAGLDVMQIVELFEKRPVSCTVSPEKEEVNAGENIVIEITDFKDEMGSKSREFNRIVVHALNGTIENGKECELGPDYKVFMINEGVVTVYYEVPDSCKSDDDNILVYNACDVLPYYRVPYSKTKPDKKIAEKNIKINYGYDAVLILTATRHKTVSTHLNSMSRVEQTDCYRSSKENLEVNEQTEATVRINLSYGEKMEVKMGDDYIINQGMIFFTRVNAEITEFNYNYDYNFYLYHDISGSECNAKGYEEEISISKQLVNKPTMDIYHLISGSDVGYLNPLEHNVIGVFFDPKTGKALKLGFTEAGIFFQCNETVRRRERSWPTNNPPKTSTRTESSEEKFGIFPVEDPIPDPYPLKENYEPLFDTVAKEMQKAKEQYNEEKLKLLPAEERKAIEEILKMMPEMPAAEKEAKSTDKINPDLLVKEGNGIDDFGGGGKKSKEEKLDGGNKREDLTFSWHMTLIKKQTK